MDDNKHFIRRYQSNDELAVVKIWHQANQVAYPFLPTWQALTLEQATTIFRKVILANCTLWVGTRDERVVAYLAMNGSYLDRLYVDPVEQRQGWGTRFIAYAKQLQPLGLELHTHQENHAARMFYQKHGFVAVKFGISPPPESVPDVEYHWRP
jgi:GNAT superfamily N-acetyltransferase